MSNERRLDRHRGGPAPIHVDRRTATLEIGSMRYMLAIFESQKNFEQRDETKESSYIAAWRAYHKALMASGTYQGGLPLKGVETATTVRVKDGRRLVQDGPFAEAKEQLGGFIILEVPTLDVALDWAARCPAAATGGIEVRPVDDQVLARVAGEPARNG
jgi:hypothetical protein